MADVNPSPIRPPRKWLDDPEISKDVQDLYFFFYQLLQRTGGGTDFIEGNTESITIINNELSLLDQYKPTVQAQLNVINDRLGSGNALTSDETGFTVDSTKLSVDMTEA